MNVALLIAYSRNIFELDTISEEDFNNEWRVFRANANRSSAMNEYYKLDSKGEKEFAEKLENNQNVLLFAKLKKVVLLLIHRMEIILLTGRLYVGRRA